MEISCDCGARFEVPEAYVGRVGRCRQCQGVVRLVAGELPAKGMGDGDFRARLVIEEGPERIGEQLLLGGDRAIEVGKLPSKAIVLGGMRVSRNHCRLVRHGGVEAPWCLEDMGSLNGSVVNGERVQSQELRCGDEIQIGEYRLRYRSGPAKAEVGEAPGGEAVSEEAGDVGEEAGDIYDVVEPAPAVHEPAFGAAAVEMEVERQARAELMSHRVNCPRCQQLMPPGAKICVACGIDLRTGRRLVTARGIDENDLHVRAENAVRVISWFIPVGPFYPIASEAYGSKRPYTTWGVAIVTLIASVLFWVAVLGAGGDELPGANLMLWPTGELDAATILAIYGDDELFAEKMQQLEGKTAGKKLVMAAYEAMPADYRIESQFRWHQLITHAFLHADLLHIAGNLLFLLVFGSRVNALIGNIQTIILYPLLAVAAGVAHLLFGVSNLFVPMVGASGAIMGLAGMYFVFFPVHKVYMVSWIRLGLFMGFRLWYKVFAVRGFWVVLTYIAFDVVATLLRAEDGVAHWAHLGGFIVGMAVGVAMLLCRLVDAHGGDLLALLLGRRGGAGMARRNA